MTELNEHELWGRWLTYRTWSDTPDRQLHRYLYMATALGLSPSEMYALSMHGAFLPTEHAEREVLHHMLVVQVEINGYHGYHYEDNPEDGTGGTYTKDDKFVRWEVFSNYMRIAIFDGRWVYYEWHNNYRTDISVELGNSMNISHVTMDKFIDYLSKDIM